MGLFIHSEAASQRVGESFNPTTPELQRSDRMVPLAQAPGASRCAGARGGGRTLLGRFSGAT